MLVPGGPSAEDDMPMESKEPTPSVGSIVSAQVKWFYFLLFVCQLVGVCCLGLGKKGVVLMVSVVFVWGIEYMIDDSPCTLQV